jgi:hypothetical protein
MALQHADTLRGALGDSLGYIGMAAYVRTVEKKNEEVLLLDTVRAANMKHLKKLCDDRGRTLHQYEAAFFRMEREMKQMENEINTLRSGLEAPGTAAQVGFSDTRTALPAPSMGTYRLGLSCSQTGRRSGSGAQEGTY